MKNKHIAIFAFIILNAVFHLNGGLWAQGELWASVDKPIKIPVEFTAAQLRPGTKTIVRAPVQMACSGIPIGGFMMCANEGNATPSLDRNDWWNCCAPTGWLPSEAYEYNFPAIETVYPCVTGVQVEELILTITVQNVTFDMTSPYACCEDYLEGLYANLYDNCPPGSNCLVAGDGLTNGGVGDCAASGDHLMYDPVSGSFPSGLPFTSVTTCLNTLIGTNEELGVDIVPSFRYQDAAANGCNCTQDLITQGFISVEYDLEVEFRFCEEDLPSGCYPSTFTQVGPLCETDPSVTLPTTSNNGFTGTWNPAVIDPTGLGGTTVTATFTPDVGQCVGGISEMDIVINAATVPMFTQIGPLCENDPPVNLPTTSNNGVMGTWDAGTTFNPNGQGGNTVTITFTPNAGLCAATQTMDIVVDDEVTPTFTQIGPLCENDPPVNLPTTSNNGVMGTWDVGTTFNPSGQGGNTVTINFTPNAGECAASQSMDIMVEDEVTPTFTQIGPLCENDPPVALPATSNNGVTGTWDVGTTFNPSGQGGMSVTINFTPNASECATMQTMTIMVDDEITPTFTQIGPLCESDPPVPLPTTSNNGVMGTWDVGATFDPTGQGGMNVTINFTPNAGECATTQTMTIMVEDEVTPMFDPIGPVCENAGPIPLPLVSTNGIAGSWDVGNFFDPTGQGGNTVTITFTPNANECASTTQMNIVVEEEGTPTFTPIGPLCESDNPVPLPNTSLNGYTGSWDVGATFDPNGQGGGFVTITFFPTAGQCAEDVDMDIFVNEEVTPTFDPIGPFCEDDDPFALPAISNEGITGTWDIGSVFDPNGMAGTTVITFIPDAGQCAATVFESILVNEVPAYTIDEVACNPGFNDYFVEIQTTGDMVSSTVGTIVNNGSGNFVVDGIPTGVDVTITITNSSNGCDVEFDVTAPNCSCPTIPPPTGMDVEICENEPLPSLTASVGAGLEVDWYDAATGGVLLLGNSTTYNPTSAGVFYAEAIDPLTNCTSNIRTPIELIIIPLDTTYDQATTCDPALVGLDTTVYQTSTCDSVVITETSLLVGDETNLTASSCDPLMVGLDTMFLQNQNGCDSLVITETTLSPADTMFATATTCDPLLVGFDTIIYMTSTCDSVVITETSLLVGDETNLTASSCDPLMVGLDTMFLQNQNGCDSLVITETTLSPADTMFATATTCDPLLVGLDTIIYMTSTCDSVVITETSLLTGDETNLTASSCDPLTVGLDTVFLQNQNGCDSLVITETTLSPADTMFATATTCDPLLVGFDTIIYMTSTCDSVVITETTLLMGDETNLTASSCDPLMVGLDTMFLQNQNGCDSLVITETTLSPADTMFATATTCDPLLVGLDTIIYMTSTCDSVVITETSLLMGDETNLTASSCDPLMVGLDTMFLQNQNGCDSLVITETTLAQGSETTLPDFSCDPNEVGLDTVVLTNVNGCDSLVITNTMLSDADTTYSSSMTCDPVLVGMDTVVFQTATCDSVVITTTSLAQGSEEFFTEMTCDAAAVGLDTVVLQNQNGCDSLVITETILEVIDPTFLTASSCDPANVGVDTVVFQTATCDSLVITTTTLSLPSETVFAQTTCIASEVGSDTLILVNQAGCDSLVITNTTLEGGIENALITTIQPDCDEALGAIQISDIEGGASPYIYSIDGGATFGTASDFATLPAGFYEIIIEDAAGCQFAGQTELVQINPPEIFFDPDLIDLPLGETVTLQPNTTANIDSLQNINWNPIDLLSCIDCFEPIASPLTTTEYTISIIDENGCMDSASVLVRVIDETRIYTPNSFSPNNDGVNDVFVIYSDEGYIKTVRNMKVFDRWGDNVFESYDFPPNQEAFGWNGEREGQPVEQGVHVFLAEVELVNGEVKLLKGKLQ